MIMKSIVPKYTPCEVKAQTWEFIENRFIVDWGDEHARMLELVRHIRATELSKRLFGSTSMDKLVISIYDPMDYWKESLHITFDLHSNQWLFRYFALPFGDPEFIRTYDAEKGIEKFDNFLVMLNW